MYKGIKAKSQNYKCIYPQDRIVTTQEQTNVNGYITTKPKRTKKPNYTDRQISWKDYEIVNLLATGAINELKEQTIKHSNEQLARNASNAERTIEAIQKYGETENEA